MPDESTRRDLPHEPPLATSDLLPLGGSLGTNLEDFRVDEIPAYLPSGQGDHRYVRIEKRGLSTPEAVQLIARAAKVPERDIGTAGLKDKHAVTTQWLSLPRRSLGASEWSLPDAIRVLEESYHGNKLRTGHLHGNRFGLRLVGLDANARERLPAWVERVRCGVPNAFAEQRFGRDGQNVGAAIEWLKDPSQLRGPKARFLSKLYPSVVQAELFNRYLSRRHAQGPSQLLLGEVVRLHGSGASFVVEDLGAEQARFEQGELHPLGPMFGPKMRPAAAAALELENEILAELGLEASQLEQLSAHAPGTRRDLWITPEDFSAELESLAAPGDEQGPDAVLDQTLSARLTFSLPAGSYATHLLREFTHQAWFAPRARH